MNNMMVVDYCGLFIYVENRYFGSFCNVNILHESNMHANWCKFFVHIDEYFEYLFRDLGYMGEEMFVMRHLGTHELALGHDLDVVGTYKKCM